MNELREERLNWTEATSTNHNSEHLEMLKTRKLEFTSVKYGKILLLMLFVNLTSLNVGYAVAYSN